jgi:hypothetical protein
VARETFQTWQDRDVANVASEMFQTWQERRFKGGKRDVKVERETLRGIISNVATMGETLQDVAIATMLYIFKKKYNINTKRDRYINLC